MRGKTGCPMGIATRIPHGRELARGACPKLSREARFRLGIFDFCFMESAKFSADGKPNAALTCRHFGIQRPYFCYWPKKYDKHRLASLESRSRAPKRKRQASHSWRLVAAVRKIREEDPTYSAKKTIPILLRDKALALAGVAVPSMATIGRLIKKEGMFCRADTARRKKRPRKGPSAALRKRKPYGLKAGGARKTIEFAVVHAAKTPSSFGAKAAAQKAIARFGRDACFLNDNGPEDMGRLEEYLAKEETTLRTHERGRTVRNNRRLARQIPPPQAP